MGINPLSPEGRKLLREIAEATASDESKTPTAAAEA
jgi:hypothetical protein